MSLSTVSIPIQCLSTTGTPMERLQACANHSTVAEVNDSPARPSTKITLAKNLASLLDESSNLNDIRPKSRMELKRALELRIKKRVKQQYMNGKFHGLMTSVITNPETLQDAYNCLRLNANVDTASDIDNFSTEHLAEELASGSFDISANTFSISTRGLNKEILVLPQLKLKVVQEAIRIALEVVYKPQFSKISHGCRSGRGRHSALKYIRKEIKNPDWWFTLIISKKLDKCILDKLISIMEEKIEDPRLYDIIRGMYDAQVLNIEFGGYPKGHGLPQEGVLSPILVNIYLNVFDHEIYRLSMKYEALNSSSHVHGDQQNSMLRSWFRKQIKGDDLRNVSEENFGPRMYSCRFMDELFFAVSGSQDVALGFRSDIVGFLKNDLFLDVTSETEIISSTKSQAIRFLGTLFKRSEKDSPAVRAVHKLKEKVQAFALQKQEAWDVGTIRIGKKWLGHGLKKVKESEIKHLADSSSLLSQISSLRKAGMETDHWYKFLLKIWMQEIKPKAAESEEFILSKYVAEPALPQELRDSFHEFQKLAKEYVNSETATTLALLPNSNSDPEMTTGIIAPLNVIKKRLLRYGLITSKGHSCVNRRLIIQDKTHIIDWFSGIVRRWLRWYGDCDNFADIELLIKTEVWQSCIRTLAAKFRIHESEVERQFDSDLSKILSTEEIEQEIENDKSSSLAFENDEALMYGISYSGQCLLSLARMVSESRPCNCFVMGCSSPAPSVYALHVMERQKFPGWMTGFSICIHPSLNGRRIGLCNQHLQDLYAGLISLQSIDFSSWK
ncbi:nuclear intron maturase 4, mitochondrial isoform X2 [Euphorbia lathyris]|uniref:nuclear intron maturase 4, mitochondrial isoform X2 n=1 Tax=Euphorbia lathyris TaxID=212925 RepID=UPI0033138016